MKFPCIVFFAIIFATAVSAEIHTETVEYHHGDIVLEGYLAYDDALSGKRPGVLVIHEWTGINDYTKSRVRQLAELGYIVFAGDIYGKGIRPQTSEDAARQATIYRSDRALMRARAKAGLDWLKNHDLTDPHRTAAIGYCFGGGTVLELARSGAELGGVVSFHGNLDTPDPIDAKQIKAKVLVLHGADDPHVSEEQIAAFFEEMRAAGVDWQMVFYGGAVHSFTNPGSGDDPSRGVAYNTNADRRSWEAMKGFFAELFE
ncbi:MAG: dienelactone hydrolase family protein [candidate division Zixibacteria bacterium]|nr:dienelactone hydrolase family protein [candidate division Zixibacteria bacterium]